MPLSAHASSQPVILPVILAGGTGTRLWPLSREQFPKQFLSLTENSSLLQVTARRAAALPGVAAPVVICGEEQRFLVGEQMRACGSAGATVLIEPVGRNTAPAAACAAHFAQKHYGPDALVFLMAADHLIERGFHNFGYCGDARYHWSILRSCFFSDCLNRAGHRCSIFEGQVPGDSTTP